MGIFGFTRPPPKNDEVWSRESNIIREDELFKGKYLQQTTGIQMIIKVKLNIEPKPILRKEWVF